MLPPCVISVHHIPKEDKMCRAVIFLSLATLVVAESDFTEKYTFTKVMASCLGGETYYDYLARVGTAQRECQQLPVSSLQTVGYPIYPQPGYLHSQAGYSPYIQQPTHYQGNPGPVFGAPQGYPQYHGVPQTYPQHQGGPRYYPQHHGGPQSYPQYSSLPNTYPQYSGVPNTHPQHYVPKSYSHYLQKRESQEAAATVAPVSTGATVPTGTPVSTGAPVSTGTTVSTKPPQKQPFFDKYYLLDSVNTITASLSNYTCVLHKLGFIDQYLNLRVDNYIKHYSQKPISNELKKDLTDGVAYCRDLTYCLPIERLKSPLPLNLQRLLLAMKCEKETRTDACFKEDLRKNIHEFDLSLFPKNDTQESKLNKLSAIVMEADSLDELQIL